MHDPIAMADHVALGGHKYIIAMEQKCPPIAVAARSIAEKA